MAKDFYGILGVSKTASADEIKTAYRKLAHQHHPDKGGDQAKFKEINEAYQILGDANKRQQYDQFGQTFDGNMGGDQSGFSGFGGQGFGGFENIHFDFGGGGGFDGFGNLNDIFEDFFGGSADTQAQIEITPAQAILGDEIDAIFGNERLRFKIPAGTEDGASFRFRNKGNETRRGRGDLIINIKIKLPRKISREERHLYEQLKNVERH